MEVGDQVFKSFSARISKQKSTQPFFELSQFLSSHTGFDRFCESNCTFIHTLQKLKIMTK